MTNPFPKNNTVADGIDEKGVSNDELERAAQEFRGHMWVDSVLLNYTEELDVSIPDSSLPDQNKRISRRLSLGLTVKSDVRAPVRVLHFAASKSLNYLLNVEKEQWLNEEIMKMEVEQVKQTLHLKAEEASKSNDTAQAQKPV